MKPRLLDLFCGAGGAAMGYHRAGFEVVGVDIKPQPHYPFEFHQADALEYVAEHGREFNAIHASPPCQAYSKTHAMRRAFKYPDLLLPTREALVACGVPWVLENVPGSPIHAGMLLCGSMFGLRVQRHRYFEGIGLPALAPFSCDHRGYWLNCYQSGVNRHGTDREYADEVGVTWAPSRGRSKTAGTGALEAIPPAYTEWIGRQLLAALETVA